MLVCHCTGVSDRAIRKLVRDGSGTLDEVGRACGAGTCCGGCVPQVEAVIHSEANHRESATSSAATQLARIAS